MEMRNQAASALTQPAPLADAVDPMGAQADTRQSWHAAARLLLAAVGCSVDVNAASSLPELARLVRASGFHLARVPLVLGAVPAQSGLLGSLVQLADQRWVALRAGQEQPRPLAPSGEPAEPLLPEELQGLVSAWVLTERLLDMRSVWPFLQRYKSYFIDLFVAAVIVNMFALALPLFSSFVYDKILANGIFETLWALVIALMLLVGVEFSVRMVRINIAERFAVGSEVEIDSSFFHKLLQTRSNKLPAIGVLLEKYKQLVAYRDFLSSSYVLAMADLPFLSLFLLALVLVAGPLALVPLVCGTLLLLSNLILTPPILDYERKSRQFSEERLGLMNDVLTSHEVVIGSALRGGLSQRWRQASVAAVLNGSRSRYWRGLGQTVTTSISYVSFVAVLVVGVYMVEARSLTSGGLLAASMLTSRIMGSFASVIMLMLRYREFRTAMTELDQVLPEAPAQTAHSHGTLLGAVRFDDVSVRLRQGDKPVLAGVSLRINPGEIVGIAGAPGSGKTTLLRLIVGALSPDQGSILIDNIPVGQLSAQDVSQNIGFKPQEFCLLDGTVEDNVRAGRTALSSAQRSQVLRASGLVRLFDEGSLHWETPVGARGSNVSGGQRQLISLARALLGEPSLLLLDEPTNGLDEPLEKNLAEQLLALRGKSTLLISTHSRSMLSICDRIIVIGQGRILADGPRSKILL